MFQNCYHSITRLGDTPSRPCAEALPALRPNRLHALAYHGMYTEGNWPGQRHRFLRNLSLQDWVTLYGPDYCRSSDYINSHPRAFGNATRVLVSLGNLFEECAEILQRTTTWHMRAIGSIIPATLRDLSGKGRFCVRLERALSAQPESLGGLSLCKGRDMDQFHEALVQAKIINKQSQLICDLHSAPTQAALRRALERAMSGPGNIAPECRQTVERILPGLIIALRQADMRSLWKALSARKRMAYAVGATLSTGTQLGINLLLLLASSSLLASVVGKTLAVAGLLYGASFAFRLLATLQVGVCGNYKGLNTGPSATYRSLAECAMINTRSLRDRLYRRLGVLPADARTRWVNVDGLSLTRQEFVSANFAWHGRAGLASVNERRAAMVMVEGTQRLTDLVYAADNVLARLLGRSIRLGFCAWRDYRQLAGWSGGSQCAYDWQTPDYRNRGLGRLRLSIARLIGIGGADVLGACLACLMVSGAWTMVSKATGGLGTVAVIGGTEAIVPVASSVVGAVGWSVSLLGEGVLRIMRHHG